MILGLTLIGGLAPATAAAQDAPAPPPVDQDSLQRIAERLAAPAPRFAISFRQPRFYSLTVFKLPFKLSSIPEDMKTWDVAVTPIAAPGQPAGAIRAGAAMDLGALVGMLFHADPNAQARQLRDRIDRELIALTAKKQ